MSLFEKGRQFFYNVTSIPVKYHGLVNQGATCYLNSVLQVMFMTKDFTEAVERYTSENPDTECMDLPLKELFDDLKGYETYTYKITNKLGIKRVYEQQDAAEYFEKILNLTSPQASQIFHGLLTHRTKCSTCFTETDTDGAFWHLPLALVNSYSEHYSVVDGIEEYFKTTEFSRENQMYCEHCDDKSDATTQSVIKRHPEVLMLLLKRFEFNYSYMTYVKNNCIVEVPCTLQIPENQTYELYAVVDHFGDLRSGHYTATIKDDERWYTFDDTRVSLSDYQPFQVDNLETSSSAYLLFYRRRKVHAADTCTQDIREVSPPGAFPSDIIDIYDQSHDVKMRRIEEIEMAAEAGNDTAVAVSLNRNAETNEQAEKRETFSRETELEESVEDQGNGSEIPDDVRQRGPQEGLEGCDIHNPSYNVQKQEQEISNTNVREEYPQVCLDTQREMDVNRDKDGKISGDEQSERRDLNRDAEHQESGGLDDNRQNIHENLGGTQVKPASVDKQGDEERMQRVVEVHRARKAGADERGLASGGSKQKMPKYDHESKQRSSGRYEGHEQHREEKRDVKGDKEQKRGHDKHSQSRETQSRQHFGRDVADQNIGGLDVRKDTSVRNNDVAVETKEHEETGYNKPIQDRADSSLTRTGSSRLTEKQGVNSVEKTRHRQQKIRPEYNEDTVEERRGPKKTKTYQDSGGLDGVRQNISEDLGGTQEVRQDYVYKIASVDKQGDEERMKRVVEVDREGKTGADERGLASGRSTLLTKYDLCSHQIQDNRRVCDSEQKMPKDDQESKQRSSSKYKRREQHREEKRDVKGDKEQKGGHDKHSQSRETSERQQHFGRDVEVQNIRGLDVRQETNVRHTINKDVAVETKEQEETGYNKPIQDRADSSLRRTGSAGSSRLTENQGVDSVEDRVEERRGSKKTYQVKIIEEEITETPSGTQISCETKHIGTVEETSQ
ncbi:uncharacterized protein LOC118337749 [Morone saxatilis]|uniref:uncharacterized protein LOC118337749 n=1 Tax=Morone saxatilis TaxID=34816 RepID=UPI0015E1F20F|nr:uncharacterized protein LOC118337749 [Morone saxatilis]